jgi:hypothetical protein
VHRADVTWRDTLPDELRALNDVPPPDLERWTRPDTDAAAWWRRRFPEDNLRVTDKGHVLRPTRRKG